MEIIWMLLGGLGIGCAWKLQTWISKKQLKLSMVSWAGILTVIFLALFSLAWAISSIEEGESQAAGMGLLLIGGSALVVFALTRKQVLKDMGNSVNQEV